MTETLTERATGIIRRSILDLDLEPGSRVDEGLLMKTFGISRTPAREALNRLVAEDLVRIEPNRGAVIAELDLGEVEAFFDAYFATEQLVAQYCRRTPELAAALSDANAALEKSLMVGDAGRIEADNARFHSLLIDATANRFVVRFCLGLQNHARRLTQLIYRMEAAKGLAHDQEHAHILADHRAIIAAIAEADDSALQNAMRQHAEQFYGRLIAVLAPERGRQFRPLPRRRDTEIAG
jgi:DNA-binding GntR family transcriptional regulator